MSQGDEFELHRGATTNPEQEQKGTKGGQKREHADDGMTAAPKTLYFFGFGGGVSRHGFRPSLAARPLAQQCRVRQ